MAKSDNTPPMDETELYRRGMAQDAHNILKELGITKLLEARQEEAYAMLAGLEVGDVKKMIYIQAIIKFYDHFNYDLTRVLASGSVRSIIEKRLGK